MNDPFVLREAAAAAGATAKAPGTDEDRVKATYLRFLSRYPTAAETARARDFLAQVPAPKNDRDTGQAAWTAFCQAVYASAEFRFS